MAKHRELLRLNLGCGTNKLKGYINIDCEKSVKPDAFLNFAQDKLPFKNDSVDEVVMFHTIEHIKKFSHPYILTEIRRVLKVGSRVIISYPDFNKCVDNWRNNYRGKKSFWENTIFGRQMFPSDYHVCIMEQKELTMVLRRVGFDHIIHRAEPAQEWNTITAARKSTRRHAIYSEVMNSLHYQIYKEQ